MMQDVCQLHCGRVDPHVEFLGGFPHGGGQQVLPVLQVPGRHEVPVAVHPWRTLAQPE
nr:hypothetical protein [Carbonactinospora thermoautotrophica]